MYLSWWLIGVVMVPTLLLENKVKARYYVMYPSINEKSNQIFKNRETEVKRSFQIPDGKILWHNPHVGVFFRLIKVCTFICHGQSGGTQSQCLFLDSVIWQLFCSNKKLNVFRQWKITWRFMSATFIAQTFFSWNLDAQFKVETIYFPDGIPAHRRRRK